MASAAKFILVFLATLHGFCNASSLSAKEYLDLKKQLKSINKPAIMTIKTEDGDLFDCVDIYKQPAFDHPALKNHQIEMKPTSFPEGMSPSNFSGEMGLREGDCPHGSVPIRRAQMKDLIFSRSLVQNLMPGNLNSTSILAKTLTGNNRYAFMKNEREQFHGLSAVLNIWNPAVQNKKQMTSAHILMGKGSSPEDLQYVVAGYMVHGEIYNDLKSRIFVGWMVDGNKGCVNALCPGFVQVSRRLPLGHALGYLSKYGGIQFIQKFTIHKAASGHWWFTFNNVPVGYWPKELLPDLTVGAIGSWGGTVHAAEDSSVMPPMGSGHFSGEGWRKASYMKRLMFVDTANRLNNVTHLDAVHTAPTCYNINDVGFVGDKWGRSFYYGGPGGAVC